MRIKRQNNDNIMMAFDFVIFHHILTDRLFPLPYESLHIHLGQTATLDGSPDIPITNTYVVGGLSMVLTCRGRRLPPLPSILSMIFRSILSHLPLLRGWTVVCDGAKSVLSDLEQSKSESNVLSDDPSSSSYSRYCSIVIWSNSRHDIIAMMMYV